MNCTSLDFRMRASRRRTNVLFYYEFLGLGGVETTLLNRLTALRAVEIDAQFWHSKFHCDGARYLANTGYVRTVQKNKVGALAAEGNFDVIVVIDNPSVLIDVLKICPNTPTFFETHVSYVSQLHKFYSEVNNPHLSGIIVPSAYNKMLIEKHAVTVTNQIFVINNIVNEDLFSRVSESDSQTAPLILWIGRLEDDKNPHDLVRVAAILDQQAPEFRFLVIADSWEYEHYLERLKSSFRQWPSNMMFLRNVPYERMAAFYRLAAHCGGALLCTSHYESAPMILLEAMLFGCPIVSSAVGGIPGIVECGKTGLLFKPGDVNSAANLIRLVASTPTLRTEIVANAIGYVNANNSQTTVAPYWRSLFRLATAQNFKRARQSSEMS